MMEDIAALVHGECAPWPSRQTLVGCLRAAGLTVVEGKFSVRVSDCGHFVFQQYGGDIAEPRIDADADDTETMVREAALVSAALTAANIRHRFEVYGPGDDLAAYLHHDWPLDA
jgi:hypothetical protein